MLQEIDFEKGINPSEHSGWLSSINDSLFFIKNWIGEAYLLDQDYKIIKKKKIEYSGEGDINKEYFGDGFSSYYCEAYSIAKFRGRVAIMREVDFEEGINFNFSDIDDKYIRKRIHIIN